ncbi:MAG: aldehyde dehydrogenase family protein [Paralcaligenes sp.]
MSALIKLKGDLQWPLHQTKMLIGGDLVDSESGRRFDVVNPADESVIGSAPLGSALDVDHAVDAAQRAQPAWSALGVAARASRLHEIARKLAVHAKEILEVEVMDTGNTIARMKTDVAKSIEVFGYFAGLGYEMKGHSVPSSPENLHFSTREPYGVVGGIAPFNHPILFAAMRMAAPLMAGNTVVIKPSEQSPLSASILAEICAEVLPAGVANIVSGLGVEAGDALVRHPMVKRIAFTGSVPTGLMIQRSAAESAVKHVSVELGGKNPMIVFPDFDVRKAVAMAINGMNFAWAGQSCGSTSRIFVHDTLYDRFVALLQERVAAIRLGAPMDERSEMGPVNSSQQYRKVLNYVSIAHADGARLLHGGKRPPGTMFERGYWIEPTVFVDVSHTMRIAQEEVFGPIMSVLRWSSMDDMVQMVNSTNLGLTASILTKDLNTAFTVARRVQAGYVWINGCSTHFRGTSFGGFKSSGVGREEGLEELLSYTEEKTYHVFLE